jgi:hypothetical protein
VIDPTHTKGTQMARSALIYLNPYRENKLKLVAKALVVDLSAEGGNRDP